MLATPIGRRSFIQVKAIATQIFSNSQNARILDESKTITSLFVNQVSENGYVDGGLGF